MAATAFGYVGVLVSDPWLQNQFTQVELRSLKSQYLAMRDLSDGGMKMTAADLAGRMSDLKLAGGSLSDEERGSFRDSFPDLGQPADFELFLRMYLKLQGHTGTKNSSAFLKAATTTLLHTISESEKASYVEHINNYLAGDEFLKKIIPIDPLTDDLFEIAKDGVLMCKLINVAVPGTIDERAINTKALLNPWERNENHTLCLNSAKAIGCTVVNIGTEDLIEGRPHLVLGLISQIIKIQLLADVNLKKTPLLVELVEENKDLDELMNLAPEKILLKWMNFQLKKGGYSRTVTNFSSDVKDAEAYTCLLNILAPEHSSGSSVTVKDSLERAKLVLEHAERMVEGSTNLNLAFVAHIFQKRNGLSSKAKQITIFETMEDIQVSREERVFRMWINSLGISTYVNNIFEDLRDGWILLETIDKISPGTVCWKTTSRPPIKMPFRKVENCNQVVKIGKQLKFSLVNVAGNDIVQGNKKLILVDAIQHPPTVKESEISFPGKDITDVDILNWANNKVKDSGRRSHIESLKDKTLSNGIFFLSLLSAVAPRAVDWTLVKSGETEDERKLNASYIITVARKLGCSIFLLPEDILEVNQKMMLTLVASIMFRCSRPSPEDSSGPSDTDGGAHRRTPPPRLRRRRAGADYSLRTTTLPKTLLPADVV
ncbi:unnamed protein product [Spirodela intermedia]|uniref:Calponin-homology (CH) domain-containing protein n=1 Tax=Spirodela intermedia TaxID=51605 RepID=A0A7I8IPD9_SPIIN|nr:unnamed protein product [Spirodela intermedia]CAA6659837.1 unnamed protein product [Spirodela intermedia]